LIFEPYLPSQKEFDPKNANPCQDCSHCCEYMALEIDVPTDAADFDQVRWYLLHKNVWVYVDHDRSWNLQFNTPCEKLGNGLCEHYKKRPQLCRDYEPSDCPRFDEASTEEHLFKSETDLLNYLAIKKPGVYKKLKEKSLKEGGTLN